MLAFGNFQDFYSCQSPGAWLELALAAAWASDAFLARASAPDSGSTLDDAAVTAATLGSAAPAVDRAFDLATILSVSVGPRWQTVDPAARATLADVFRVYTIVSYVANFNKYGGERFDVTEATRAVGADQVVSTRIVPTSGDGVKLDYLMRQSDMGWRVVDVLADGTISRVAVQRSDFRALLGRDMNTAALLDSLRRKIADLSGGAVA